MISILIIYSDFPEDIRSYMSGIVHTRVEVCRMDLWNNLGFSLCAALSVCHMVATSDDRKKSKMGVSANWCVAIETPEIKFNKSYLC